MSIDTQMEDWLKRTIPYAPKYTADTGEVFALCPTCETLIKMSDGDAYRDHQEAEHDQG